MIPALLFVALTAHAQSGPSFPGHAPEKQFLKAQEKADQLFERGQYKRAMMIYRNDLAPVGDKYAQYMVGYMYLAAKGVDADAARASAWYRLAAERGHESFVRARDDLLQTLDDEQRSRAEQIFPDLRDELGDIAIISKLITEDLVELRRRRGIDRRIGLSVISGGNRSEDRARFRRLSKLTEARTNYLVARAASDKSISDKERNEISRLQREVTQVLGSSRSSQ